MREAWPAARRASVRWPIPSPSRVRSVADRRGPSPRRVAGEAADQALGWRLRAGGWSALVGLLGALALPALMVRLARRSKGLVGLAEKLSGDGQALRPGQLMVHGVSLG